MLALLIIAHPDDTKFKNIIVKLQIDWMLIQDRENLDVREGFWRGVNASNLYRVFSREEEREAEVELLADYHTLFKEFVPAQKAIAPYLPEWAHGAVRNRSSSQTQPTSINVAARSVQRIDEEDDGGQGAARDSGGGEHTFSAEDVRLFRKHWNPPAPANQDELDRESQHLAAWLAERLASGDGQGEPLTKWCQYWRTRHEQSRNYQEQVIVQSLFRQSVRRLYSLHAISTEITCVQSMAATQHPEKDFAAPLDVLYAVADMEDGELRPPLGAALARQTESFLQALSLHRGLEDATRRLTRLVESASPCSGEVRDMLNRVLQGQTSMLHHITTQSFSEYFYGIMAFSTLRTLALLDGLEDATVSDEAELWRARRGLLFTPGVISSLKLTAWQLQALLLPGADCGQVLTRWQELVFLSSFCGSKWKDIAMVDMEHVELVSLSHDHLSIKSTDSMVDSILLPLFGKAERPECIPFTPRLLTPEPSAPSTATPAPSVSTGTGIAAPLVPEEPTRSNPPSVSASTCDSAHRPPLRRPSYGIAAGASSPATSVDTQSSHPAIVRNAFSSSAPHTYGSSAQITPNTATAISTARPARSTPATASSPARSLSRPPSNPPAGRNAFSSQTHTPAKRAGSPLGSRQPKLPRIGFRGELDDLRQDLRRELEAHREELRAERERMLTSLHAKASEDRSRMNLGGIRADLETVSADLGTVKVDLASTGTSLEELKAELVTFRSEVVDKQNSSTQESQSSIQQLREELRSSAQRQDQMIGKISKAVDVRLDAVVDEWATSTAHMLAEMKEMRSVVAEIRSRPEDNGYLAQICPAPAGESQRAYESRLFRSCLSYIYTLWDPIYDNGSGVGQNEQALEDVKQRFPDLDEDSIVKAIKYFHTLVFNRPLGSNGA